MATTISRTAYNALVDDDGSGTTGTIWSKSNVDDVLDAIDALFTGSGFAFSTDFVLSRDTSDGSDTGLLQLSGGGAGSASRGGNLLLYGNEASGAGGYVRIYPGNVAGSRVSILAANASIIAFDIWGADGTATFTSTSGTGAWVFNSSATNGGYQSFQRSSGERGRLGSALAAGGIATNDDMLLSATVGKLYFASTAGMVGPAGDNSYTCGDGTHRWVSVWATNGTIQTSDLREKTIVGDALGLDFVRQLRPFAYRWRRDDGRLHYGLGAQDVLAHAPAGAFIVGTDTDGYGMNYAEFIAPLVRAVQELSDRLDALMRV